jgi:glycosyltransferase involved in cell wall biosynthesis
VVLNDDAVESGGAAMMALASARLLRQRRIPVTFLSGKNTAAPDLYRLGVDVEFLGGRHILDGARGTAALRGLYDRTTRRGLEHWIDANDTPGTVYHVHNWHKILSPSVLGALMRVAPRVFFTAHDYFLACPTGGYFLYHKQAECELVPGSPRCIATPCDRRNYGHKLWRVARHRVRQKLFDLSASTATVIAVHEGMLPHLARAGIAADNLRVLRNPVVPWRSSRVPAERNRDFLFIGRLDSVKGVDLLARAAERAGVRLRIVGDGPLAATISREYPDAELLGWRNQDEIGEIIANARVIVSPTRCRETFGLVALQALVTGVPVIVSRFSLFAGEIVRAGFGFACDPYDEETFAATIRRLAQDDRLIREMSCRAFAEAQSLAPTPDQWCEALLELYRSRLSGRDELPPLGSAWSARHEVVDRPTERDLPESVQC